MKGCCISLSLLLAPAVWVWASASDPSKSVGLRVTSVVASTGAAPDLLLLHGRIHTQDARRSIVQALAVRGDLIIAVGSDREVSALATRQTRIIDLKNRIVLPGMIDAHTHPAQSAQDLGKCNLQDQLMSA